MSSANHGEEKHRTRLPAAQFCGSEFSMWSVLKQGIGTELSKITMPVVFNEPLSFLQRVTEYLEYAWLLDKACAEEDPVDRMQYVMAFAVSGLASNWERLGKPFNPLLGETYELRRDGYRIVAEQVCHHPPVSAFHAEADQWFFHGSIQPRLKFWGKSVEIQPKGTLTLELLRHGEAYTWSNVNCCVHNLISGQLWMEQYGTMEILNHVTGHKGVLTFKTGGGGGAARDLHRVEGFICDKDKRRMRFLYGRWTELLCSTDVTSYEEYKAANPAMFGREDLRKKSGEESRGGSASGLSSRKMFSKFNSITSSFRISIDPEAAFEPEEAAVHEEDEDGRGQIPRTSSCYSVEIPNSNTLWEVMPRPEQSSQYYHFTSFALGLNEKNPEALEDLAPTDSRLRPDIRLLEEGDIEGASNEKTRLEEKQRDTRKTRKKKYKDEWKSRWFEQGTNAFTHHSDWLYSGRYWDRNYTDLEQIF
uniref:Oxysterol-binding protein n=3 Tax=Hirondellea gigas TaxID=1518452 RepID=A0A6A7FV43_9CRUS